MVGASYGSATRANVSDAAKPETYWECREIETLMTSGSLLKISAFAVSGLFDQSLFMDCVDHEFCLRLRKHGFKVVQAKNVWLAHQPGSPSSHQILWKKVQTTNHSPQRRYHNAHNRVMVYRRYAPSEPWWAIRDIYDWIKDGIKVVLLEDNRREKFLSIVKGAWVALWKPPTAPDTAIGQ
jgi:rhamnosyltransferase